MTKNLVLAFIAFFTFVSVAEAQYFRPYPRPHYPSYPTYPTYPSYPTPYPYYPQPIQPYMVTCFAQGTFNGVVFYGTGYDVYSANQRALFVCQSSGQYCVSTVCR